MNETPTDTTQALVLHCANHPSTETTLRCNRCEKPICAKCAVLTPTGYRCKECVRGQQKVFDTAEARDYFIAVPVAGILSFIGGLIVPSLGFFTIFLAPAAGGIIAEIVRRTIQKRRSMRLFQFITAAVVIGALFPLCTTLLGFAAAFFMGENAGNFLGGFGFSLIWRGVYTFVAASTVYYRLSGIRI
jgi:MFS family permease